MKESEKKRLQNYTARLNLILLGCGSATCPFADKGTIGDAALCNCRKTSVQLSIAIGDTLAKALKEQS